MRPRALSRAPASRLQGGSLPPRSPSPPAPLQRLTPPCLAAAPASSARGREVRAPPAADCSRAAGRPPFKASRLPGPPPSRRGLGPHPGDCAGARGLHMPGRSARHWSKSLRAAGAERAAERGPGAGRTHGAQGAAAPGCSWPRAGREGRHPAPGAGAGGRGGGEGGESLLRAAWSRRREPPRIPALGGGAARLPGARGCPSSPRPSRRPAGGAARERPLGQQGRGRRRNK